MSDKRIIDLPTLQTALGNDAWLVVDIESGATYKIKKSALLGLQALETQSQEVYGAINEVRSLAEDLVSDEYDATSDYAKGDYCIHNNTLYKCTTAIGSGGEAWNASHWSATKCDDELSQLKQSLDALDTVDDIKYVRGKADISSTTYNTVLLKIQKFITDLVTDGHYTKFDVIINSGGRYSFQGYVYPEKNYGAGILLSYDGLIINWRRSNNTDNLYNITVTT